MAHSSNEMKWINIEFLAATKQLYELFSLSVCHTFLTDYVTWNKKSPILTRIERFRTVTQVWLHGWIGNNAQSLM